MEFHIMESYIILILYDINITQLFVFWKTCMNYITIQSSVKYKKRNKNDNLIHCHVYRAKGLIENGIIIYLRYIINI